MTNTLRSALMATLDALSTAVQDLYVEGMIGFEVYSEVYDAANRATEAIQDLT